MKVFIVGVDKRVEYIFNRKGWDIAKSIRASDLVVFTGGADINPALYGEKAHPTTYMNMPRDFEEIRAFTEALNIDKPMAGICRGAQLMNVLCGGGMWQDVVGHCVAGTHKAIRLDTPKPVTLNLTSTHHQMMRPGPTGEVVLIAESVGMVESCDEIDYIQGIECVVYKKQKCLCFQAHPEWPHADETKALFFEYIDKYFDLKE